MTLPQTRQLPVDHSALVLGEDTGVLLGTSGGWPVADVISASAKPGHPIDKHLGALNYEPITMLCGAGMPPAVYAWIKEALAGSPAPRNGAVVSLEPLGGVRSQLDFLGARLTAIGFPALDRAAHDHAGITLTAVPEQTRFHRRPDTPLPDLSPPAPWARNAFRLSLSDMEEACAQITTVGPLVLKRAVTKITVGGTRTATPTLAFSVPNLVLTLPEEAAEPFYDWFDDFALHGNNGPEQEKAGTLAYLGSDPERPLFALSFSGLGIFRLTVEPAAAARYIRAELYCQGITFDVPAPLPT
jgi:hypothetical protein